MKKRIALAGLLGLAVLLVSPCNNGCTSIKKENNYYLTNSNSIFNPNGNTLVINRRPRLETEKPFQIHKNETTKTYTVNRESNHRESYTKITATRKTTSSFP